ncbi:MAG TPA: undecaprenyl-diphosphatase UppP [Candidatus Kapabacteria bacterium]|nr:undecaprenyl-diphosphatase UppP [Candidatus Kapabacteria bacterium]HPO62197.1 undecaprenyl-diphosphatase UppP [Candidatus Kapabacteria bacterium]
MTIIEAIILGIIQGLSEFIPISSTAHLTLAGHLFNLIDPSHPERWTAFIAVIQLGTLAAVFLYFSKDIKSIISNYFSENLGKNRKSFIEQSNHSKLGWLIIIGSLPIGLFGFLLKDLIEGDFTKSPFVIATMLILVAIILFIAEKTAKFKKGINKISIKDSIIVGFAQCLALIPGTSRSGATITTGLFLGIKRDDAARFSFLLSIPAIFASGLYEFYKSITYINSQDLFIIIVATIVSAISGYLSIAFLLKFLKTKSTLLFIVYRIVLGLVVFFYFL